MDQIDVRIDNTSHGCFPFNFTETQLLCVLPKATIKKIENSSVDVQVCMNKFFQ